MSIIVFGSFARREAGPDSDIDVVVVRPTDIDEDDEARAESIEGWRRDVRRLAGNPVEVLEVSDDEAASWLTGQSQVWADIRRESPRRSRPQPRSPRERPQCLGAPAAPGQPQKMQVGFNFNKANDRLTARRDRDQGAGRGQTCGQSSPPSSSPSHTSSWWGLRGTPGRSRYRMSSPQ